MLPILRKLLQKMNSGTSVHLTQAKGDATKLTQRLIQEGAIKIIAAGGDGTINEVLNGFFKGERLCNPECELGIIKCGTGQGLALSLNISDSLCKQLHVCLKIWD